MCNSVGARRKRGNDTRDAVQQVTHENLKKKIRVGECENQDEHRGLRRLMGDGLWTCLGKKKSNVQTIPKQQRSYDAVTTEKDADARCD
jgi:hypothetical protein